ncbi:hypothetical protein FQZ97_954860 [compost metagenome]
MLGRAGQVQPLHTRYLVLRQFRRRSATEELRGKGANTEDIAIAHHLRVTMVIQRRFDVPTDDLRTVDVGGVLAHFIEDPASHFFLDRIPTLQADLFKFQWREVVQVESCLAFRRSGLVVVALHRDQRRQVVAGHAPVFVLVELLAHGGQVAGNALDQHRHLVLGAGLPDRCLGQGDLLVDGAMRGQLDLACVLDDLWVDAFQEHTQIPGVDIGYHRFASIDHVAAD